MMQPLLTSCVLLAAGFDWLESLLPFVFVVFWIVSQVVAVLRRLQGAGRQPVPPPRPLPRFDPASGQPRPLQPEAERPGDLRGELEKQIAEFLREAKRERKPARPAEPIRPHAPRKEKSPEAQRPRPQAGESVARHVRDVFSHELSDLPKPPAAGDTLDGRRRGGVSGDQLPAVIAAQRAVPTQTEELVHLLRSPSTIRQAILLREVLDRPVDRW